MGLIVILVVVLAVVIGIAGSMGGRPDPTEPDGSRPGDPAQTGSSAALSVSMEGDAEYTVADTAVFTGTSDPAAELTVNGQPVPREADGSFRCEVKLNVGENAIVFAHKDRTERFSVLRRYAVQSYAPADSRSYNSGATIHFEVLAREGSTVTAAFNGKTVTLKPSEHQQGSGAAEHYVLYVGEYTFSESYNADTELGVITYAAICDGVTETYNSGTITCLKTPPVKPTDPDVTPSGGDYIDVGSGYIGEILIYSAETFDGRTVDDYSRPTNSYLPKGTVDYCSGQIVKNGNLQYVLLRCGRRVYLEKRDAVAGITTQVTDCYKGRLPDHNELGFVSMREVGNHTILTLDSLWKAPFDFDLLPQSYAYPGGGSDRNYKVTACTATYVDITFCYATKFTGTVKIPAGNPLFKSAELIQNQYDCTLRLYLKKTGGFYGWDCYYNEKDQLCFKFLNPAKVTAADNAYGANLSGVTIMIDVGHGGKDGGATGTDAEGTRWSESGRNMDLAYALRDKLQSMGATVIFNREGKQSLTVDERLQLLKNTAPDFCIAIHHNSIGGYPNISGFGSYYYTPFSALAAKLIYEQTVGSSVYRGHELEWHYYYVARQTVCPVVLTENGYMSNLADLNGTLDPTVIGKKADAIAKGIADYFLQINK